MKQGPIALEIR